NVMQFNLKSKGIITLTTREMVQDLTAIGVSTGKIDEIIHIVTRGAGVEALGNVDQHSVAWIALEGLIAAKIQLVQEMHDAYGFSVSGDGTMNNHLNHKSKHACICVQSYSPSIKPITPVLGESLPVQHFLGINHAVTHTSQCRLDGWIEMVKHIHQTYNSSLKGQHWPLDQWNFAQLVKAMNTNHTNNQKKLFQMFTDLKESCEAEMHDGEVFETLESLADIYPILWEEIERVIEAAGGEDVWDALNADERQEWECKAYWSTCVHIRKDKMDAMTPEELCSILFCLAFQGPGGCSMHKLLNGVKGGVAAVAEYWKSQGLPGLVKLANKD
ncbi:hypothetical protein BOTBODRAFT_87640, partial [Botryobasidium botryosum FD-172 SS1]